MRTNYDCVPFFNQRDFRKYNKVSVCAILNRNFDLIDVIFVKVVSIFFGLDTFFMLKTIINSVRYHYLI